jgi:hypothetical protein
MEGRWVWGGIDGTDVTVRQDGRIVSMAMIIAGGANTVGRHAVPTPPAKPAGDQPNALRRTGRRPITALTHFRS